MMRKTKCMTIHHHSSLYMTLSVPTRLLDHAHHSSSPSSTPPPATGLRSFVTQHFPIVIVACAFFRGLPPLSGFWRVIDH